MSDQKLLVLVCDSSWVSENFKSKFLSELEAILREKGRHSVRTLIFAGAPEVSANSRGLFAIFNRLRLHVSCWFRILSTLFLQGYDPLDVCFFCLSSSPRIQRSVLSIGAIFKFTVHLWVNEISREPLPDAFADRLLRFDFTNKGKKHSMNFIFPDEYTRRFFKLGRDFEVTPSFVVPWASYLEPARALRVPDKKSNLRFVFHGILEANQDFSALYASIAKLDRNSQGRISITFVGLPIEIRIVLRNLLADLNITIIFWQITHSLDEILAELPTYDFAMVIQEPGLFLFEPLFYTSQGLPIVYMGPPFTYASNLVKDGWGLLLEQVFDFESKDWPENFVARGGEVLPSPRTKGESAVLSIVEKSFLRLEAEREKKLNQA